MRGHVRRSAGMKTWQAIYELGHQPAQRCQICNKRLWVERRRLESCPVCAGDLKDRTERRQGCQSGFRTKKDAEEALNEILGSLQQATYVEPTKLTLREYLRDEWLPAVEATVRPATYVSYTTHVEVHITPELGSVPLVKLSGSRINAFYGKLLAEGCRSRKGRKRAKNAERSLKEKPPTGLSPATVRRIHATLHKALRDAVRWGRLQRSPADAADPPAVRTTAANEMKTWTGEQLRGFLHKNREARLHPLWRTLAMTGMRRGEALGIRWADMDLEGDGPRLMIRQALVTVGYEARFSEPKTHRSRRAIPLDEETVAVLKTWRKVQRKERMRWGALWTDTGLVFTREDGSAWHPDRISKLFETAVLESGLPRIRLHDLRHYADCRIMPTCEVEPRLAAAELFSVSA